MGNEVLTIEYLSDEELLEEYVEMKKIGIGDLIPEWYSDRKEFNEVRRNIKREILKRMGNNK